MLRLIAVKNHLAGRVVAQKKIYCNTARHVRAGNIQGMAKLPLAVREVIFC
jgi:hypothetical protein